MESVQRPSFELDMLGPVLGIQELSLQAIAALVPSPLALVSFVRACSAVGTLTYR